MVHKQKLKTIFIFSLCLIFMGAGLAPLVPTAEAEDKELIEPEVDGEWNVNTQEEWQEVDTWANTFTLDLIWQNVQNWTTYFELDLIWQDVEVWNNIFELDLVWQHADAWQNIFELDLVWQSVQEWHNTITLDLVWQNIEDWTNKMGEPVWFLVTEWTGDFEGAWADYLEFSVLVVLVLINLSVLSVGKLKNTLLQVVLGLSTAAIPWTVAISIGAPMFPIMISFLGITQIGDAIRRVW